MHADAPSSCENCTTPLQGGYCHVCGQRAANPLRHFGHAVEEVFEAFWHLDGRVFRTLRDLAVPGRVACNYLAGHRVRYIAPLRLFVVLTVLTFFIGQIAVSVGGGEESGGERSSGVVSIGDDTSNAIARAKTEAEVDATLKRQLAELDEARKQTAVIPGVRRGLDEAEQELRARAARRIAALRAQAAAPNAASTPSGDASAAAQARPTAASPSAPRTGAAATPAKDTATPESAAASAATAAAAKPTTEDDSRDTRKGLEQMAAAMGTLRDPKKAWHERDNPVDVAWLPAFADGWLNHRLSNMEHNVERINRDGVSLLFKLAFAAVPPALFVLVPVFALLLKALYLFSRRGYLEHLVVALYSHAAMLLVLFVTFAMILVRAAAPDSAWISVPTFTVQTVLWLALPVYLFVMQHRVYRQHWLATAGKYIVLGSAYTWLVALVMAYGMIAALTSGT